VPFAELRGLRFYYERQGEGEPLLVFNGSGQDLRRKPGLLDGPLPSAFDVTIHDQRHLGRSANPEGPSTMADYADDGAALLDHLGLERCHVAGVSFGGMVAQEFAIRHGERVQRLVLACTSSGGEGGASYPLHELALLPPEERAIRQLELMDTRYDADWREANPGPFATIQAMMDPSKQPGADEPGRTEGLTRQMEARRGHDTSDRLHTIAAPTLVCGGRHDGIAPPANLEALVARIPRARLELFDGGHVFLVQDPKAWPAIIAFLGGDAEQTEDA
jgi:3-oxoadipate enol-lactonase